MSELGARLIGLLLAGLLALAGGMYVRALHAELETAQGAKDLAEQGNTERDATIKDLQDSEKRQALARASLERERNTIRSNLSTREILIRNLQNENAQLRAWSDVALPDAVVRLRQHGPLTGATSYSASLPGRQPLPAASSSGQD